MGSVFDDILGPASQAAAAPKGSAFDDVLGPAPAAPEPSFLQQVAQPFKDIGRGILSANDFAMRAITHPKDMLASHPGATLREGMRGLNSNIPFANQAIEAIGGPPAQSAEDAQLAPGAQAFGGVAGAAPIGGMVGGIAAKGLETVAPALGRAVGRIGEAAEDRQTNRALADLQEKTFKRTRAGVRDDVVADAVAEHPELRTAETDAQRQAAVDTMREKAHAELESIYSAPKAPPTKLAPLVSQPASREAAERAFMGGGESFDANTEVNHATVGGDTVAATPAGKPTPIKGTLNTAVKNFDERIEELRGGDVTDRAVAKRLESVRDEFSSSLGSRENLNVKHLRAEQTAFQKLAYRKGLTAEDTLAGQAADEAQRAIGDAVVQHVTGMPYAEAKAAAELDPNGTAARLFKANDQINAANKIEASIADRAGRVQPPEDLAGKLRSFGHNLRHPVGYALELGPRIAAHGLESADNALANLAGPGAPAAGQAIARAATPGNGAALGQLIQFARQGLRGSELTAMAQQLGVPPDRAADFADLVSQSDARRQ